MSKRRAHIPDQKKLQIIDLVKTNKKSIEQIEAEYGVSRYQIQRWEARFLALSRANGETPIIPIGYQAKSRVDIHASNGHEDPRDRLIMQLQIKVANQAIEIDKLKASVHGNKRYSDRQLYINPMSQDGQSDGNGSSSL